MKSRALLQTMWEVRHRAVLEQVFAGLSQSGISFIVLKGTALAYGLYPNPALRYRGDTDMLISAQSLEACRDRLDRTGFRLSAICTPGVDDLLLQETWDRNEADGTFHSIDLHWHILKSLALQQAFAFEECLAHSAELPALGHGARMLDWPLALIYALLHRAEHISGAYFSNGQAYYGGNRLIWLVDIDKLARSLDRSGWDTFIAMVRTHGAEAVCLDGLMIAARLFETPMPEDVAGALRAGDADSSLSVYLMRSGGHGRALADLRAVPGLRGKLRYLKLRLIPPERAIRSQFPDRPRDSLISLHVRRLLGWSRPT